MYFPRFGTSFIEKERPNLCSLFISSNAFIDSLLIGSVFTHEAELFVAAQSAITFASVSYMPTFNNLTYISCCSITNGKKGKEIKWMFYYAAARMSSLALTDATSFIAFDIVGSACNCRTALSKVLLACVTRLCSSRNK